MHSNSETEQEAETAADEITAIASRFRDGPRALGPRALGPRALGPRVLVCTEVLHGAPILVVCRKGFIWQFGCGKDHSDGHVWEEDDDPRLGLTIRDVVARDPSVCEVATLNDRHIAHRATASESWVPHDDLSLWWF
jgi:hypothetical protein